MDNVPTDALARLMAQHGIGLLDDARRLKALLQDEFPEQRRATALLVAVVEEGIAARLQHAIEAGHSESQIELLAQQLQQDRGLSADAARWAVDQWVAALDETPSDAGYDADSVDGAWSEPSDDAARSRGTTPKAEEVDATGPRDGQSHDRRAHEQPMGAEARHVSAGSRGHASNAQGSDGLRHLPKLAAAALVLIVVLGLAGLALARTDDDPPPPPPPTATPTPDPPDPTQGPPDPTPEPPTPAPEPPPDADIAYLEGLEQDCLFGDYTKCDELYRESPLDSAFEEFGSRCGNFSYAPTNGQCSILYDSASAYGYGDDPYLDATQDLCEQNDMYFCDELFSQSGIGSLYEEVGATCNYLVPDRSAAGACEQTSA